MDRPIKTNTNEKKIAGQLRGACVDGLIKYKYKHKYRYRYEYRYKYKYKHNFTEVNTDENINKKKIAGQLRA